MTIVIYMKEGCPYCQKVKDKIKNTDKKDEVEIYYADKDFTTKEFKDKYGSDATFPRGYLQEKDKIEMIGGSDDIIEKLENN